MITKFELYNEGIQHWFRKNDFLLDGFIGKKINLKIGDNRIVEHEIISPPKYSYNEHKWGGYSRFWIYLNFFQEKGESTNEDPYGEEVWNEDQETIGSIVIYDTQIVDREEYFDKFGNFDWDNVPASVLIKRNDIPEQALSPSEKNIKTDENGVKLITQLVIKIADKEKWITGSPSGNGFHSLRYFIKEELERGHSIF